MANIDNLLQDLSVDHFNFFDDLDASSDIWSLPPPPALELEQQQQRSDNCRDDGMSSYMNYIEKFLMEGEQNEDKEEQEEQFDDGFFASLFMNEGGAEIGGQVGSEGSDNVVAVDDNVEKTSSNDGDGDGDDPLSKKRKRQMRNRESAMQSRERKKIYVKELEMKSKYLEQECRRLDYALRCCAAENLALRQRLQMEASTAGASAAKQESAVLFEESLLLGSLFVLVSTIFLFLMPNLDIQNLVCRSIMARGLGKEAVVGRKMVNKREKTLYFGSLMKRCRGMRTRIKFFLLPLCAVSA